MQPYDYYRVPSRLLVLLALAGLLAGCPATAPVGPRPDATPGRAASFAAAGQYREAATIYEELARTADAPQRDRWLLEAAEQWYSANEVAEARRNLSQIEGPLPMAERVQFVLLAGNIDLRAGEPERALARLEALGKPYARDFAPALLQLEGRAHFQAGDLVAGVTSLVQREALFVDDPTEVLANHWRLWNELKAAGAGDVETPVLTETDPVVAGWLALGSIATESDRNPFVLETRLAAWRERYPDHPAGTDLVAELLASYEALTQYPERVALLLPLSGRQRRAAEAVRDGFLAAYFQHEAQAERPGIRIYDTSLLGAGDAYGRAMADGTDFIVGPLTKDGVASVAQMSSGDLRMLALNNLPDDAPVPRTLFQFALAPEDEARQAAARARADGHARGVALVPDTEWGMRLLASFATAFQAEGGTLLAFRVYDPGAQDFTAPITQLLQLNESRSRHRTLESRLGVGLEFDPRRRRDAEFVFLGARARQGRQIRPQLRFHFAGDLPVYATSAAYEPDPDPRRRNNELLNGVVFADIPWMLSPDTTSVEIRGTLAELWPRQSGRRSRLFALGFDAYRLVPLFHNQVEPLRGPVSGMTGVLTTDAQGRVHRQLVWAQIRAGEPRVLPTSIAVAEPPTDGG